MRKLLALIVVLCLLAVVVVCESEILTSTSEANTDGADLMLQAQSFLMEKQAECDEIGDNIVRMEEIIEEIGKMEGIAEASKLSEYVQQKTNILNKVKELRVTIQDEINAMKELLGETQK